ncbi:restriction endonuclease subunit S [Companilactobacillus furfuricola]|uniref:restriction endonuclease subunit S n=1 Tax=Companilactobacillus furfuricola TaxID=1462575 RepID=UPI000F7A2EBA|nr:restriction endonuclease subunit S [Companilactobacillus furfuricola]
MIESNLKYFSNHLLQINNTNLSLGDPTLTVSDHVANGSFKSLKENVKIFDQPNYSLFIRNIDFKNGIHGNLKYVDKKTYAFLKKSHLRKGDVVISNVGDVGSVHRVPMLNTPMVVGNNEIFIHSEVPQVNDYLYSFFKSFVGQRMIQSITSGSAQQKFNKTDFRKLSISLPSVSWIDTNISNYLALTDNIYLENRALNSIKLNLIKQLI